MASGEVKNLLLSPSWGPLPSKVLELDFLCSPFSGGFRISGREHLTEDALVEGPDLFRLFLFPDLSFVEDIELALPDPRSGRSRGALVVAGLRVTLAWSLA